MSRSGAKVPRAGDLIAGYRRLLKERRRLPANEAYRDCEGLAPLEGAVPDELVQLLLLLQECQDEDVDPAEVLALLERCPSSLPA